MLISKKCLACGSEAVSELPRPGRPCYLYAKAETALLPRLFRRLGQILTEEEAQFRDGVRKLVGERIVVHIRIPFDGAADLVRQHLGAFRREDVVVLRVDHGEFFIFCKNKILSKNKNG